MAIATRRPYKEPGGNDALASKPGSPPHPKTNARALRLRLNSNKGTKTLTGLSPKAFEQGCESLRRGGTARRASHCT